MIENIGNPKVTRVHLAELQTFYKAQLEAYRHYTALQASLKPLQDAADALRASGVVDVDVLLEQPVSATKAMIDEMEAEADADDDELNDLTLWECEEEDDAMFQSRPEGDGWMRNTGIQPLANNAQVETVHEDGSLQHGGASDYFWQLDAERVNKIIWYREAQPVEQEAEPARKFKAGDRVRDKLRSADGTVTGYTELGSVEFQIDGRDYTLLSDEEHLELIVDHAAEVTAQLEAQAETESTEPEAEPETAETMQAIAQAVEAVDAEPEEEQAVHVFGEGEVQTFGEEGVFTEQPETVDPVTPSQPEEPKAERKTLDCTDDYTQEEVQALSGFDPRTQSDDIAAAEREEFDASRRHAYNPWALTAKAEG